MHEALEGGQGSGAIGAGSSRGGIPRLARCSSRTEREIQQTPTPANGSAIKTQNNRLILMNEDAFTRSGVKNDMKRGNSPFHCSLSGALGASRRVKRATGCAPWMGLHQLLHRRQWKTESLRRPRRGCNDTALVVNELVQSASITGHQEPYESEHQVTRVSPSRAVCQMHEAAQTRYERRTGRRTAGHGLIRQVISRCACFCGVHPHY